MLRAQASGRCVRSGSNASPRSPAVLPDLFNNQTGILCAVRPVRHNHPFPDEISAVGYGVFAIRIKNAHISKDIGAVAICQIDKPDETSCTIKIMKGTGVKLVGQCSSQGKFFHWLQIPICQQAPHLDITYPPAHRGRCASMASMTLRNWGWWSTQTSSSSPSALIRCL